MTKFNIPFDLLKEVEAVEERLETMKLSVGASSRRLGLTTIRSIIRSTAGLLEGRVSSGLAYERKLRRTWESEFRRRIA